MLEFGIIIIVLGLALDGFGFLDALFTGFWTIIATLVALACAISLYAKLGIWLIVIAVSPLVTLLITGFLNGLLADKGDPEPPPKHRVFGPTRYRICTGCGIRNPARPACPVCGGREFTTYKLGPNRLVRIMLWIIGWHPPKGGEKPCYDGHVASKAERVIGRVLLLLALIAVAVFALLVQ